MSAALQCRGQARQGTRVEHRLPRGCSRRDKLIRDEVVVLLSPVADGVHHRRVTALERDCQRCQEKGQQPHAAWLGKAVHGQGAKQRKEQSTGPTGSPRGPGAEGGRPVVGLVARGCQDRGLAQRLLVLEDALHRLVAALHATSLDVVLARAHAGSDVLRLAAPFAASFGSGKVGVADHLPDRLDAIVRLCRVGVVPGILPKAIQMSEVGRVGGAVLLANQGGHALLLGALRFRNSDIVVHRPLAEVDRERCVFHGGAIPFCRVAKSVKVFQAWEHWINASEGSGTAREGSKITCMGSQNGYTYTRQVNQQPPFFRVAIVLQADWVVCEHFLRSGTE